VVTSRLDVSDFRALVPKMAMAYPFELDDFQKQVRWCVWGGGSGLLKWVGGWRLVWGRKEGDGWLVGWLLD
jgi:hypothetical protein